MALLFSLREFGQAFATRGRGEELRNEFLARSAGQEVTKIDFTDVTNVSYSFADEFLGVLVSSTRDAPRVELVNMAESVERVVTQAMSRRRGEPVPC
jgi:hypothetical protein